MMCFFFSTSRERV